MSSIENSPVNCLDLITKNASHIASQICPVVLCDRRGLWTLKDNNGSDTVATINNLYLFAYNGTGPVTHENIKFKFDIWISKPRIHDCVCPDCLICKDIIKTMNLDNDKRKKEYDLINKNTTESIQEYDKMQENKVKNMKKTNNNPCCVCNEYTRTNFFVSNNYSCGHVCVCEYCASKLETCPLCRFEGESMTAYF